MQPKLSIIIPVYNVEPYLRQCLDSVVNQSLRDIQVICVNDGSTDGSLAILREYETRDSRIEIIDKPNGGQSSARNAGIERVRGKYLYFLDSDDWITPTLCEKTYYRLESTGADVVLFFYHEVPEKGQESRLSNPLSYCRHSVTRPQAHNLFEFFCVPWNRVIRTSFFRSLGVQFPEKFLPEDLYLHWILLVNNPHVELILEKLYHYRLLGRSIVSGRGSEYLGRTCQAFSLIKRYLQHVGKYEQYRDLLLTQKISNFVWYTSNRRDVHPDALRWFRESLDDEEIDFILNDASLKPRLRTPVLCLLGSNSLYWKYIWHIFNTRFLKKFTKPIERLAKPFSPRNVAECESRIRELSEQLAQRDHIIVDLRNHQNQLERRVA